MSYFRCPKCGKTFEESSDDKIGRYAQNTFAVIAGIGACFFNQHAGHAVHHALKGHPKCPYCGEKVED